MTPEDLSEMDRKTHDLLQDPAERARFLRFVQATASKDKKRPRIFIGQGPILLKVDDE
jgi:hypothetical protein